MKRIWAKVLSFFGVKPKQTETTKDCFQERQWDPEIKKYVRFSAKVAVFLFVLAFSASSLCRLRPGPTTKWILRNRRYLGVGYAVAHTVHLGALGLLALFFRAAPPSRVGAHGSNNCLGVRAHAICCWCIEINRAVIPEMHIGMRT